MELNELRFQDPRTLTYLGSPSLVRLPDGALLATHDYFGPGCPRNHENEEHLTSVYRSENDGATWSNITHVANAYWSTLFVHRGAAWLLGVSQQYGSIVIRRSDDGGYTWTHPVDAGSGLLFRGGFYHEPPNYHTSSVPVLFAKGRVFKAFEDGMWGGGFRGSGFMSLVVSAPDDADLLDASSWSMTEKLGINSFWPAFKEHGCVWIEGNVVEAPDGRLLNILRLNGESVPGKAAVLELSDDGGTLRAKPDEMLIDMPGAHTKFVIRRDMRSGLYLTLANANDARNSLSLCASADLRGWQVEKTILSDDSGLSPEQSAKLTGFQYVDWQFDGDDLVALVRTAYNGAHNFHDSNRITFHRIENYRSLIENV